MKEEQLKQNLATKSLSVEWIQYVYLTSVCTVRNQEGQLTYRGTRKQGGLKKHTVVFVFAVRTDDSTHSGKNTVDWCIVVQDTQVFKIMKRSLVLRPYMLQKNMNPEAM